MGSRSEAKARIRYEVWSGEYDPGEVFIIIDEEVFDSDGEHDDWLRTTIRKEFQKKRAAERTWPKVTDYDRLDQLFSALREQGILAVHDAGYTQSEGWEDAFEVYRDEGGKRSGITGLCFHTTQDMESAIDGDGLWLAYGHISGDGRKGVVIGRRLRASCEEFGFAVEWNGSVKTRILLKGFRWQRRGPKGRL
ncbi:MAG: hypothetical protein L0241_04630 [Planctomycetia bacterium]|nr:hypothetical protein [Planctomycetia bacterium]